MNLSKWLDESNVGESLISNRLPGSLKEIHCVSGGWIYVFKHLVITCKGNSVNIHTQFVKREGKRYSTL